jgi:hypothetical protein
MKQAENNEMDTLLRNLARRERAARSASGAASAELASQGAHLDIDELSSYAERALPPSARARCTAHLADCDDCRKIVAQLSMAAGPLVEERKAPEVAVPGLTWIQRISTFFSPGLIRVAAPALVLIVVVFAFFGWRQQRQDNGRGLVALNQHLEPGSAVKAQNESPSVSGRPTQTDSNAAAGTKSQDSREAKESRSAPASTPASAVGTEKREETKAAGEATSTAAPAKAGKEDAPPADKKAEQPAYAMEPAPPPAAKQQSTATQTQEQQGQKDLAKNNTDNLDRGRDANVQRKGPARGENEVASQRGPAKPAAKAKSPDAAAGGRLGSSDDEIETRTVFGRHFRHLGNAWVDTAYNSSMSIRSVTRGTDAYNALIADEPAIEGFSKQLAGEVIVVWKGPAYRIN